MDSGGQSVRQKVLIFDKPKDGWNAGAAEKQGNAPAPAAGALDLGDLLGALRTQMGNVEKDYLKPSARGVCGHCREAITGDLLMCRGRVFHTNHFCCSGCKKSLGTDNFHYKDSVSQYCEPCYINKLNPVCIACEKPIVGRHTYWNGTPFHVECFTCSRCDSRIDTTMFAVVNSAPFCLKCEGGSAVDTRESTHRKGKCPSCGLVGEDNFCEKCGTPLNF